jgi:translation initiation factor IF-1
MINRTEPDRSLLLLLLAVVLAVIVTGCASAGGSRETPAPQQTAGPVEGTVVAIDEVDGGQLLTLQRGDGTEVYVEIPERLARTLRIREGDRVWSEENTLARPGERLRVQRLQIQRG